MFIPRYWSEAKHRESLPKRRQVTVHRFGWSSTSQEDADVHARQRLEGALAVLRREGPDGLSDFTRRERVVAYAGSDGLPIREEIVGELAGTDAVLTRNGYGAVCLNTQTAMFVDVDRAEDAAGTYGCLGGFLGGVLGGIGTCVEGSNLVVGIAAGAAVFWFLGWLLGYLVHVFAGRHRNLLRWTTRRVEKWCATRDRWRVAVYETPGGVRLLVLHTGFTPTDVGTADEFMRFVRADPLYVRMCHLQKCFRARVSPKPWRIDLADHFKTGGTWPVRDPAKLARRRDWVQRYEALARDYASCRFVEVIGKGAEDSRVAAIRRHHDELCGAESGRPLA